VRDSRNRSAVIGLVLWLSPQRERATLSAMGEVLAPLVSVMFLVAFVAFIVWLFRYAAREQAERVAAWARFCAQHGFTFTPQTGSFLSLRPARIDGRVGTVQFSIDTFTVSNGKSSTTYTRLLSAAMQGMPLDARVYRETIFGSLGDLLGAQDVTVGDPAFDTAFVVKATREDLVRQWLHAPLRATLVQFCFGPEPRDGTLHYRQGQLELTWLGAEKSPAALHAAVSVAVEAASFRGVEQGAFR
jgi:hypothetical protein